MFWGKAIKAGTDDQQGSITYNVDKDLTQTTFTLNRRIPATKEAEFKQYEALIAAILNKIINASATYNVTYGGTSYTGTVKWSDYIKVNASNGLERADNSPVFTTEELSTKEQALADAFITLNTIYPNEQRAGSGPTVAKLLGDLYDVINKIATTTPLTSKAEAVTAAVASKLETNISAVIETGARTWKTNIDDLKTFSGLDGAATNKVTDDLNKFPKELFHVPYGAAILKFIIGDDGSGNNTFTYAYNETLPTYAMDGGTGGSFNIFNYRYPAELCYFGNSPLRVTTDPYTTTQYPDGVAKWEDDTEWTEGKRFEGSVAWEKSSHVKSSTRSIAMQENINYGTALLMTTVRYGAATLNDNNAAIQLARNGVTEADKKIKVGAGTFTLTGILIGGAEETVGWNYLPFVNNTDPDNPVNPKFGSFIYDCDLPSTAIPAFTAEGAKSTPNYTLLWDNWNPANEDSKQNIVYIALEFVNNSGQDFWGMNNMIRNGATFYIAGKLDPDNGLSTTDYSAGITWPLATGEAKDGTRTYYALPPYAADGSTIKQRRVFMQDYMTEANFVIGENSLHSALVAVPDLRTTQISLGLSVDLKWQTGLSYDSIILGQ